MTNDYEANTEAVADTTISDESPLETKLVSCSSSHPGKVRELNEDRVFVSCDGQRGVFAVADGMGGHAHGEIASAEAVRVLGGALKAGVNDDVASLDALFRTIDEAVHAKVKGGGTTLVAATIFEGMLTIAHIGDSRGYLMRGGQLQRITIDDSLVESLVEAGKITAEEARVHPRRNVLLKALGPGRGDAPQVSSMRFWTGDVLMLCSDGLHGIVDDAAITREILSAGTVAEMCDRLIAAALAGGAPDNVSVVICTSVPA